MLERQVYVLEDTGIVPYLGDQLIGDLVGVAVKQADPRNVSLLRNPVEQLMERIVTVQILAVARDILRDNRQLPDTQCGQFLCLAHQLLHRAGTVAAADIRNSAVGTPVIAPLCNLEVSGIVRRGQHAVAAQLHCILILKGTVLAGGIQRFLRGLLRFDLRLDRTDSVHDTVNAADTQQGVHLRHLLEYLLAVAFRQTARHDNTLEMAILLEPRDVQDIVHRFLARAFDKGAGVDDDDIRIDVLRCDLISGFHHLV